MEKVITEREITVMRKKTLLNNSSNWYIQVDGQDYEIIHGGEVKKIHLNANSHTLLVYANDPNIGKVDKVVIPKGNSDYVFHVSLSTALMGNAFKSYIKIKQL